LFSRQFNFANGQQLLDSSEIIFYENHISCRIIEFAFLKNEINT